MIQVTTRAIPFTTLDELATRLHAELDELTRQGWKVEVVPVGERGTLLVGRRLVADASDEPSPFQTKIALAAILEKTAKLSARLVPRAETRVTPEILQAVVRSFAPAELRDALDGLDGESDDSDSARQRLMRDLAEAIHARLRAIEC
jgi:hypothetical protein